MMLLRLLPAVSFGWSAATLGAVVVAGLLPTAFILATGAAIRALPGAAGHGLFSPQGRGVLEAIAVAALLYVAAAVAEPFRLLVSQMLGRRVDLYMRERVMRATLRPHGIAHLEDQQMLDRIAAARGVGPGEFTPTMAVVGFAGIGQKYVAGLSAAIVLARFSWWVALILVVTNIASGLSFREDLVRIVEVMLGNARSQRRAIYYRDLVLAPAATKETRIFGLRLWIAQRFRAEWLVAMQHVWAERKKGRRAVAVVVAGTTAAFFLAFAWLARAAVNGVVSIASLAVYAQAIIRTGILSDLGDNDLNVSNGTAALPSALRLEADLAGAEPVRLDALPSGGMPRERIAFENLSFSYPGSERRIYDELTLEIPAGRSLAIVGANGAGKTTLVKLLAGLYEPTAGRIAVDGVDLRALEPRAWQRRVAAIFQDFVQYQLPAADNVAFGAIERAADRDAIVEAARRIGADRVIEALPNGWDTILSRQFTGGTDLSGGPWQRVALARALFAVAGGAGVLVLDEPTANLDVRAEAELFDSFLDLTRGATTILISHRFSTVRRADRIAVLHEGRVIEQGTHDELIALGGRYAGMFHLQAERFAETAPEPEPA